MITIPANIAYCVFVGWVMVVFLTLYKCLPEYRKQMRLMSLCGGIGGIIIAQFYRQDFWNPLSILDFRVGWLHLTIEDFLFGGAFTGITTVLFQTVGETYLEPEAVRVSRRWEKLSLLLATVMFGVMCYQLIWHNSVGASAVAFLIGAWMLYSSRRNLWRAALLGGTLTFAAYVGLLAPFLAIAENRHELAMELCQYCQRTNFLYAPVILSFWAFAYGAFVVPLYAWMTNQRFVDNDWHHH